MGDDQLGPPRLFEIMISPLQDRVDRAQLPGDRKPPWRAIWVLERRGELLRQPFYLIAH